MNQQATRRLTMAQAVIAFLKNQYVERDGTKHAFFAGCFGIFGHGNIGGIGQALQQMPEFRYYQARNEQAMVHAATAYTKTKNRMMNSEIVTSIQEHYKLIIVLLDNDGFKSIGSLSRSLGQEGFGTRYVYPHNGVLPSDAAGANVQTLPVDLAANARSLGAHVLECKTYADFTEALKTVQSTDRTSVIYIQDDRYQGIPSYEGCWDVPVAAVSAMPQVDRAYEEWAEMRKQERYFL